jgi:hypothetical protein
MCPTFLRSVRPGFGTSDDLLSVYERSDAKGRQSTWGQSLACGHGRGRPFVQGLVSLTGSSAPEQARKLILLLISCDSRGLGARIKC